MTDKIDRVRAQVDDIDVLDRTTAKNALWLAAQGLTVQANTWPVVFDYTQQATDALDMLRVVDGKAQPVDVQVGITDGSKTELISGELNENDPVIIGMSSGATAQSQSGVANPFQPQVPRPAGGFGRR